MGQRGRPTVAIELSDEERETLGRWARRHSSSQALALRCRIVLDAAEGLTNTAIAQRQGCHAVHTLALACPAARLPTLHY
jgi:hypothetical protein